MPKHSRRDQDGIYQRPDSPYWWATFPNGRGGSTRRSTGVAVKDDPEGLKARAVRAAWRVVAPAEPTILGPTFDDLLLAYLEQVSPTKRDPSRDKWSAKALFPVFTGKPLGSIGAADVRGYLALRKAKGVAPGTINKEVGLMSAALNWANKELEWGVANPWQSRRQAEPAGRSRWLSPEEAERLLDAAQELGRRQPRAAHLRDFCQLCLYAGLRSGEALGLTWERVDLKVGWIVFDAANQKNGKPAMVPINDHAREALVSRDAFRAEHCPDSRWVFSTRKGAHIAAIRRSFGSAARLAGLEDLHPHDLRRTFGSWMVQRGVPIDRVSQLMRHSDISVTARVYAHLRPRDLEQAIRVLDGHREGSEFHGRVSRDPDESVKDE